MNDEEYDAYYEAECNNASAQAQAEAEQWEYESKEGLDRSISALELFEKGLSKSDLKVMANATVESLLNAGNPLQVAEAISAMECFIKEVKDDKRFKDYVREEAGKTPKGYVSNSGAKIELAETGTAYDFSKCNDEILISTEAALLQFAEKVKVRKEFLKTLPCFGILITDEQTGETYKIYPPSKSSTSSYKITLAK